MTHSLQVSGTSLHIGVWECWDANGVTYYFPRPAQRLSPAALALVASAQLGGQAHATQTVFQNALAPGLRGDAPLGASSNSLADTFFPSVALRGAASRLPAAAKAHSPQAVFQNTLPSTPSEPQFVLVDFPNKDQSEQISKIKT